MSTKEKVTDYIFVKNLIPHALCQHFLREFVQPHFKWAPHVWYDPQSKDYASEKTKELEVVFATPDAFKQLRPFVEIALKDYQEKYRTQHENTGPSFIQHIVKGRFNKYTPGTKMREHYDHIHDLFDGHLKGIPILSIVALFNDDYEGGQFMIRGEEVKLTKGDILVFPSNFMYPHQVKDIIKGVRFSFVSWAF